MATNYSLKVKHDGTDYGDFCIYQTNDGQSEDIRSLVWFKKSAFPDTLLKFDWEIDYSFVWSEKGILTPGVVFEASQNLPTNPSDIGKNAVGFTKDRGAYVFTPPTSTVSQGKMGIDCDATIPANSASIGIGMSGKAAYACVASPNLKYTFMPHPRYWIAFGKFEAGEVIDLNMMTKKHEIVFGLNEYEKILQLKQDNTWAEISLVK